MICKLCKKNNKVAKNRKICKECSNKKERDNYSKKKDKKQIKITELLNCKFIIGKFGKNDFEDKATNYCYCINKYIPNEKRNIDYDSFFNNKKYVYNVYKNKKGPQYVIMENIYRLCDFEKEIDSEIFEEIKNRFPNMFEKEKKIKKFWFNVRINTTYSLDFYNRYKDELGLSGIFRIKDITFDYIIENKTLFDSYENFKEIISRQQPKKIIIVFSDLYKKYFKQYMENNEYEIIFNFFKHQWLDLEFIHVLIYEHGWKDIYQWFLDNLHAYKLAAHYYGVYSLDENPDWDYIISNIPNEDDETYTVDQLKEFILNVNLGEGKPPTPEDNTRYTLLEKKNNK